MTRSTTGLGTFAGVFTPSILTILGIILFLRLGYVVGETGLARALIVIALANAISVLTSLSVAAISTNIRVKGGGDYYLISRTLGIGFGGAIGLVLFLAQSISIGFYCMGFGEVVSQMAGLSDTAHAAQWIAAGAIAALFVLAWFGTDWATRFQYVVMAAIFAALASFIFGAAGHWNRALFDAGWSRPSDGLSFWVAFAIFFPAVTGFTQGVSMSGDLRDASHSIPRGVLSAVGVSIVVYFGVAVLLAGSQAGMVLREDYFALKRDMAWPLLFDIGVIAATLSSALASFLGAPRILQSPAQDEVFPFLSAFSHGHGPLHNPRRAVALAGAAALIVVALGNLNLVASVVSMFFLISYGLLNYATYFEARAAGPSFRPTFRFYHSRVGFAGALACLGAMLAIDLRAGVAAAAIVFGIYHYLRLRGTPSRWADSRRSHHLQQVREHLLAAAAESEHPRDWRPQLLVFSDAPERRRQLLRFARWIEGGCGLTTIVRVLVGEGTEVLEKRREALEALQSEVRDAGFDVFPLVVAGADLEDTIASVIQSAGIGPLRTNTVIANWVTAHDGRALTLATQRFSRNLRTAFRLGCNLLVLDADAVEWQTLDSVPSAERNIDIWWRQNKTGELMLLLGHLVTRADSWQGSHLRVFAEPTDGETEEDVAARLAAMLEDYRIDAEVTVCPVEPEEIVARSGDAALVFVPFSVQAGVLYGPAGGDLIAYLNKLPIVVLTLAAQDVDLDADPDTARAEVSAATPTITAD
jgi:amino acid transporter